MVMLSSDILEPGSNDSMADVLECMNDNCVEYMFEYQHENERIFSIYYREKT